MPTAFMLSCHAESTDRTLRSQISRELGSKITEFKQTYARRRVHDPGLSERGRVQVKELLDDDTERETLIITSPMQRALETALPLVRHGQLPRALLV